MPTRPGVHIIINKTKVVTETVRQLALSRVLVGWPEGQAPRLDGSGLNNATLAYIHDQGAPEINLPARPILVPGIKAIESTIATWLQAAAKDAFKGKASTVGAALTGAGLAAVSGVRGYVAKGVPPPLKASTIAKRRRRSKGSKYRRKAQSQGEVTPLIDTGALVQAVTFVLERNGKSGPY